MYARRLTKEELMKSGITEVTPDCHVFNGDHELIPSTSRTGYLIHFIFELDENGKKVLVPNEKSVFGYVYKTRSIGLHRLMWAWFNDEVPEGLVVDHINNSHDKLEDYVLENLQLLTPSENLAKDKSNWNVKEIKCQLNKPRSFYEQKLEGYTMAYEQAKKDKDAEAAHHLRCNISQTRARLRYYDNHINEYQNTSVEKRPENDCHVRAAKRRELQAKVDSARKYYKQIREAYGKDDPYTKQVWGEWKLAIAMLYGFNQENKRGA